MDRIDLRRDEDAIAAWNDAEAPEAGLADAGLPGLDRRGFLRRGLELAGGVPLAATFGAFLGRAAKGQTGGVGFGALVPTVDRTTGLPLLRLPEGFEYSSFGWAGDTRFATRLRGGAPTPGKHDGTASFRVGPDHVVLIRNHEYFPPGANDPAQAAFRGAPIYDPAAAGGTTNTLFNLSTGQVERQWASLAGTSSNCAGGPTPWGTWLTCEETFNDAGTLGFTRPHGFVFEVPTQGWARPVPLAALGRFTHEAVAIHPDDPDGIVYETEDRHTSGFYRFLPNVPGELAQGGRLQMLAVAGSPGVDLRVALPNNSEFAVEWVDVPDPTVSQGLGVYDQGRARGGATFARLEGAWPGPGGRIFFNATTGGGVNPANNTSNGPGQVWEYRPDEARLRLIFQSPGNAVLDNPDNITVSPTTGSLVLCEDGALRGQRLQVLTLEGALFPLAANNIIFGEAPDEDFSGFEWCGANFAVGQDGRIWLFANIQTPGVSFAITAPRDRWAAGLI